MRAAKGKKEIGVWLAALLLGLAGAGAQPACASLPKVPADSLPLLADELSGPQAGEAATPVLAKPHFHLLGQAHPGLGLFPLEPSSAKDASLPKTRIWGSDLKTTPSNGLDADLNRGWQEGYSLSYDETASDPSVYDYKGLRVLKQGALGYIHYAYDDKSVLLETDANNQTLAKYDYGPNRLLSQNQQTEGRSFYLFDALGSITDLTTTTGSLRATYQYDAWGNYRATTGSTFNAFAFTGHQFDSETGLYYFKARFYDPTIGRFLTEDPADGKTDNPPSLHRYLYAYANPTVYTDPDGSEVTVSKNGNVVVMDQDGRLHVFTPQMAQKDADKVQSYVYGEVQQGRMTPAQADATMVKAGLGDNINAGNLTQLAKGVDKDVKKDLQFAAKTFVITGAAAATGGLVGVGIAGAGGSALLASVGGGAAGGLGGRAASDIIEGQVSSPGTYVASAGGGAILGRVAYGLSAPSGSTSVFDSSTFSPPPPPEPQANTTVEDQDGTGIDTLNLGAGQNPMENAVNVDKRILPGINVVADANQLPFKPGTFSEVHSINPRGYQPVSQETANVMQPGGKLYVTGTAKNLDAAPLSPEDAEAAGFKLLDTEPMIPRHNFGTQRFTSGRSLTTRTSTTTTYEVFPPPPAPDGQSE